VKNFDWLPFTLPPLVAFSGPSILDSSNLGRPFYFLRPGKHTPPHSNLVRPSRVEWPTFKEGSIDP
jgi:hypothetical protein